MSRILIPILALAMILGLRLAEPVAAQERILAYDSEVEIGGDGSLHVTEHITVRAEGNQIRRGIYRDFPTRYRDRYGNRVRVDFEMISLHRNGEPEPWFTERVSNGIRINTGGDDFLPVPSEYTFTLRFRTTRQLGFFEEHDELYWNAIGTGWEFPVESAEVEVRLPEPVRVDQLGAEGYTGRQGASGQDYAAELVAPGTARYRLTRALAPREGLTVVLTFPKGVVAEPTRGERAGWFLSDNRGVLLALIGLIVLLVYCVRRWRAVGRDPRAGIIIPRYEPPGGRGPAGLRYLRRMGYDTRCFSGDILALGVGGQLRIHGGESKKDSWQLERLAPAGGVSSAPGRPGAAERSGERSAEAAAEANAPFADPLGRRTAATSASAAPTDRPGAEVAVLPAQRALLEKLFPGGARRLELKNTNASTVSGAQSAHRSALDREFHPTHFKRNTESAVAAAGIAVLSIVLAFLTSGGNGVPAIFAVAVLMLVIVLAFVQLVRAPTPEGRKLLDEIEGLKLYMSVAERDELARMSGPNQPPPLDAGRYEALLPFAVALEVEDAWTGKFTAAVGAAAAAAAASRMTWYSGRTPVTNLSHFSRAMGSSLSSQISSASTPPGSSSGSGGGGSSGGGGGGGGGGGR